MDNCFCTPALQRPLELGADIVIHSATKYLDGQGRVLGGAVLGKRELIHEPLIDVSAQRRADADPVQRLGHPQGPGNPQAAHAGAVVRDALALAQWLERHPRVQRVYYPGLPRTPSTRCGRRQQASGGGIVSFVVKGGREAAWRVVDSTRVISITANLGDVKTTITHPGQHHAWAPHRRRRASRPGSSEGLLRVAVGLESVRDIQADLARGLG